MRSISGVSHFDGHDWTHFGSEDGLADHPVWDLLEDKHGRLWFAFER